MNQPERSKSGGNRGIRANLIWISLAVIVTAGCFASNLGSAWMGGPARPAQFLMTMVYIIFWGLFSFSTLRKTEMVWVAVVMSALTSIGAVSSFIMTLLHGGFILTAILSTFASVPFYGLRFLMDWTPLYAVVSAISLVWLIYSLKNLRFVRKSR